MKNKKGFTLIELLAIIVILAIIAVITVPIILNIIENAKKGAATNSAYGYKDAIQKFYASKLTRDSDYDIPDGLHTKQDFDNMGVKVNGKQPALNSFLKTYKNMVTQGCLQFDEYKVEFLDGKPQQAEKGTCKQVDVVYTDVNNNNEIDTGDTVKIENDEFYVMSAPSDGKVKLIPKYNLNTSSRQASTDYISNFSFSGGPYWNNSYSEIKSEYRNNNNYVYTRDNQNYLYSYFENYKNYLIELGATFITDVRAASKEDAEETGCQSYTNNTCPDFMANQEFLLGTCSTSNVTSTSYVWHADGTKLTAGSKNGGYRPLVEIYESAITDEYTIKYVTRTETVIPDQKITVGSKIGTFPTNPTKTNATFEGWYTDLDYTTKVTTETVPIGSATYYARYVLSKVEYTDIGNDGINTGDTVKIMDDEFYVMSAPSGGKVKLITKYNLNSSSRQASTNYISNWAFSGGSYWNNSYSEIKSEYRNNNNYVYIRDDQNYLYYYFNNYQTYLVRQGAEFVTDVRAASKEDAEETGCQSYTDDTCPDFMSSQGFLLGTCSTSNVTSTSYVWQVNGTKLTANSIYGGYRPLVEISESAFPTN